MKKAFLIVLCLCLWEGLISAQAPEFKYVPPQQSVYWNPPAGFGKVAESWAPPPEFKWTAQPWTPPPGYPVPTKVWGPPRDFGAPPEIWMPPPEFE